MHIVCFPTETKKVESCLGFPAPEKYKYHEGNKPFGESSNLTSRKLDLREYYTPASEIIFFTSVVKIPKDLGK